VIGSPDLAALVRRARSTDPATGLSNVSTMAALLAERPRPGTGPQEAVRPDGYTDSGWIRRLRDRRDAADAEEADGDQPVRLDPHARPPVPGAALGRPLSARAPLTAEDEEEDLDWGETFATEDDDTSPADTGAPRTARRRLAVIGLPLLALALVIAFAVWFGTNVLSVAGSVDTPDGSTPPAGTTAAGSAAASSAAPSPGVAARIASAAVFDPFGDGEPENDRAVPQSFDGDPDTAWSTLKYRGSADFGNLKPGVGVVYDLGSDQSLAGVTITTTLPGAAVEVRTGGKPDGDLDAFALAASGTLTGTDDLAFASPVTARYVLVWVTGLVKTDGEFTADLAEVTVTTAG
jgi:putative peptidoglycan lipid II flippase